MPDHLPIGTVTFLFTDIEGSTRLLQGLGTDYRDVLERHAAIVRQALTEHEGVEVSTEGDAFFAVFRSATEAVAAAVAAQRSLAQDRWPKGHRVMVRMGLHTGEGRLGGDNYLGLDVHRAARIAAAGHGGQVLLSAASRVLVEARLPEGVTLRDLGTHRLKDLERPEHLAQLVIQGLEQDFPAVRTLETPTNLPIELTSFVGRQREIDEAIRLLETTRLLSLTGPGGTGKTRIAIRIAASLGSAFRDGVFFVDLAPLTDPGLVGPTVARSLGLSDQSGRPIVEVLRAHLEPRQLLLVLDSFEHLLPAGEVVQDLLAAAPRVKALVTSRSILNLYGEQTFAIPPLALPDLGAAADVDGLLQNEAVALFIERARAAKPAFSVTTENALAVAEICVRLDGLPLAIELAASRIRLLEPGEILARLARHLPMLTTGASNVPARQRTLRAAIEWSYKLLRPPEQSLFARLTIFTGGSTLESAEAVCNPGAELGLDTFDGIASLVDQSLIRQRGDAGESRFEMLETIREYGRDRLEADGALDEIGRRHVRYFRDLAEIGESHFVGSEQAGWLDRFEREHDNVRSALSRALDAGDPESGLRTAAALRDFWRLGRHIREGVRWLDEFLALPGAAGRTLLRARALTAAADLSGWMEATEAYLRLADEAVAIYRYLGDAPGIPDALEEFGVAQMLAGQLDAARASLQEARELNIGLGNRRKAGECTVALGMVTLLEGRPDQARERFEEALTTFRDVGDTFWSAFTERWVGHMDRLEGNDEAAERRYRASLLASREHGLLIVTVSVLYAFADLALVRGQHERALRLAGASEAIREREGEVWSFEVDLVGDVRKAVRSFLDEATAESLFREGRAMEVDTAVAYALQQQGA